MKRRIFFGKTSSAIVGLGITSNSFANKTKKKIKQPIKVCTTINQEEISFFVETINESIRVVHIADTHLFKDDERGIPYQEFSNRMAKAYNQTVHFKTRLNTHRSSLNHD